MKKIYRNLLFLSGLLLLFKVVAAQEGDGKVPVVMFDFTSDKQGWITHNLDAHEENAAPKVAWEWNAGNYFQVPGGFLLTQPKDGTIRNTWAISPVVDLSKVEGAEIFLSYMHRYGTHNNNKFNLHAQLEENIDLELQGDSAFIKQWGKEFVVDLDQETNEGELGIPKAGYDPTSQYYTTSPLNLSMFDGKKIRLGIHFYNIDPGANASKNLFVKSVQIAGNVIDNDPPIVAVNKIDSIGNTFVRGYVSADEICKVFWAVVPKGETVATTDDIKANIGSADFTVSGITNINAADRDYLFTISGLEINTDYTLFYGGEDFMGNISELSTVDFSTDNDLVAPIISSLEVTEITQISAMANLLSDELGTIVYRVYNAGWEPATYEEFASGSSSVRSGTLRFDTLESVKSWPIEGLTLNSSYIIYATVTDLSGNISEIMKSEIFTTLVDETAPEIISLTITDITNHGGTMKLVANEPIDGYGDAYAYWIATELGKTVTGEEVLNRTGAFASGSAKLDSATYENIIMVENLVKFVSYTIHVVVQDGSKNVSEVASYDLTTTDELESVPIFIQNFDVENQNYHFVDVNIHEDRGPVLVSNPAEGRIEVASKHVDGNDSGFWQDAWVVVGPINLTGVVDASVGFNFKAWYGLYADHVSLWINKDYKPGDILNISEWTQFSETGDFPSSNSEFTINKNIPAGFDTEGVYIGIRYYHNVWALSYYYYQLVVYGKTIGAGTPPVIDWVEANAESSTSAKISFTANDYGRMFYYLVKDGDAVEMPTYQQLIAGDGADVNGFRDYTAGNYIDQTFNIGGLEPDTKYHLYTGFRDLKYNESEEIYYDKEMTVFTTLSLDLLSLKDSAVFATNALALASGSTLGRIYWTVKGATDDAPTTLEEIISSFTRRGSVNYQLSDQSFVNWNISNLKPDSSYVCYAILADPTGTFSSEILSFPFMTSRLEIRSVVDEDPIAMDETNEIFSIPFNIKTSSIGKVYLTLTDINIIDLTAEDIVAGTAGFASSSVNVEDIDNVIIQLDDLTNEEIKQFNIWAVISSAGYLSEVYMHQRFPLYISPVEVNDSGFNTWSRESSIIVDLKQRPDRAVRIMDLSGRILAERKLDAGVNQIDSFKSGIYIVVVQQNNQISAKKVFVK